MSTDKIQLVRNNIEALNDRDWNRFRETTTDDCIIHGSRDDTTIEDYIDSVDDTEVLRDWHVEIEEIFGADDRVVTRYTGHATIDGEYHGTELSNEEASNPGIAIFQIDDGQIAEVWLTADISRRWEEAGVLPERLLET